MDIYDVANKDALLFHVTISDRTFSGRGRPRKKDAAGSSKDFQSTTAGGVAGTVEGHRVLIGKPAFLTENAEANISALEQLAAPLQAQGATAIFVAVDKRHAGVLTPADPLKSTTPQALARPA